MKNNKKYILRGGRVVDPQFGIDKIKDIAVCNGKIVEVKKDSDFEVIDMSNKVIAPGFIDLHVHLRQPGGNHKETIQTGTMAAAAGGFTSIVSMPNTTPVADTPATIEYIHRHAQDEGVVNVLPCGAMSKNREGNAMSSIGSLKKTGVVALSDDGTCIQDNATMYRIVEYSKTFQLPILDHCEDAQLANGGVMHQGYWSTVLGMKGIPSSSEEIIIARDVIIARDTDWKIHIQHISAKESVELVRYARSKNIKISAEVTPHHITLNDEEIKHYNTNHKMNPPLRAEDDRLALIEGLRDNTITVIATDHAPHTEAEKLVEFDNAPFGIVGLETAVPICLTELYHENVLNLSDFIAKFTLGPAEVLGMDIGNLKVGQSADITILDIDADNVIDKHKFHSKSMNTPFHGYKAKGKVIATIVNGKFVYTAN